MGTIINKPGHLSFLTLQRGNAFRDALRRKGREHWHERYRSCSAQRNAGTTCLINSSSDFFFSACGRLLSHQKLNSSTPSSW
ncbi:DUF1534 domain-containing protein [Pseudomonas syringae]|uniref:DUF1534 domain-containing protein n=1 Tax=Pseudomonas syringae TaxID=317 RepID=A0A9Q4A8U0_PSESX|nr:DUF1534 domain-containing protein [Pseudomonas syringae]MCF5471090.1 DUF1534 domain-containing protein [Pseudomonas syringae]MCF5486019.1 DUF1534 domain-containing protein [Pseudomonas syringae]MCF5489737.1 DUF1534 domain-containing protein [Pseudomonas syringae]MCF5493930.1 DUF1534 domain-containing protein [Pseudomonas syringae]